MNQCWKENFETYLNAAGDRGLEPFRARSDTYKELYALYEQLCADCREILSRLPGEEGEMLTQFHECSEDLLRLERYEAYRLGHLDCARLLRHLGLWEAFQ